MLIAIGTAWGATAPLSKLAVSAHHPIVITFWTTAIAAVFFNVVLLFMGKQLPVGRHHIIYFLACGILGTIIPNIASYAAYRHLPVGVMSLCFASIPIATTALSAVFGVEGLSSRRFTGIFLGLVAMVFVIAPDASLPEADQAVWVLLPVVAAISYALENVYIKKACPNGTGPLQTMAGLSVAAFALLIPQALVVGGSFEIGAFRDQDLAVLGIGFLHIAAYFGYVWLITHAGSVFASQVSYVVTASGVLFGILFYDEKHSLWIWAALGLMFLGLSMVQPRRSV